MSVRAFLYDIVMRHGTNSKYQNRDDPQYRCRRAETAPTGLSRAPMPEKRRLSDTDRKLLKSQNLFDSFHVIDKVDSLLTLLGGQSFFNHMIQKGFQGIIVTVQVIKKTGGIQML